MNETGQNKYSKEFQVPKGFDEILRNLTREILRSQPDDINKFGRSILCSLLWHYLFSFFPFSLLAYDYFTNEVQARALGSGNNQEE